MSKTIFLQGSPYCVDESRTCTEDVLPGHLAELTSTGYRKQTDDAANVARAFVLENDMLGDDITDTVASGSRVRVGFAAPGSVVYGWLASGQNVAVGDYLTSNTTGLVTKTSASATVRIAYAEEAVDTSGSAPTTGTRIKIRII